MARVQGSSVPLVIEFVIAVVVGLLAVLGGLFVVGFLLVEPIMDPHGLGDTESLFDECDRTPETVSLLFAVMDRTCPNSSMEFTKYNCNFDHCMTATGACADQARRCCCRTLQESTVDLRDFGCAITGVELPEDNRRTADSCACAPCDDIMVTVRVTVVSSANNEPIPAAQIFDTATNNMLGLTLNDGTFQFNEPLETRALSLLVQATLFVDRTVDVQLMTRPSPLEVRVVLSPRSLIAIGLGGSAVILRLGDTMAISAPPRSFYTMDGEVYTDLVFFSGMFIDADEDIDVLPIDAERFFTNDNQTFRVMEVFFLDFRDTEGNQLNVTNLRLTLSTDVNEPLFLVAFVDGEWVRVANFTEIDDARRKRQTTVLSADNVAVMTFAALAAQLNIDCFLQARTFGSVNETFRSPRPGVAVELNQRSNIANNGFLYTFGTNTGDQEPELVNHAVCLPIACIDFDTATLEATFGGTERLFPIDFDLSSFGPQESFPIGVGHIFSILEVTTSTDAGSNRPFYNSSQTCIDAASISQEDSNPLDYFAFYSPDVPPPLPVGNCFIKVQILDCFESNRVNVISFNISSPSIMQMIETSVDAIDEDILDLYDVGKTSGEFPAPDPATLTFCNSSCATPRIACVPVLCGGGIQVIVRPALTRGVNPCALTGFSPILTSDIFTGSSNPTILLIDSSIILAEEFNDENLGLYFHPDSTDLARWQCEHGPNNFTQPVTGHAATFTCFED